MNTIIPAPLIVLVILILPFSVLSCASQPPRAELADGRLRPCPSSPNCVSSEGDGASSRIEPLTFKGPPEKAWADLKEMLRQMGGTTQKEQDGYLWATFTTRIFRFVDDVEFRLVPGDGLIHVRSGSRVGYSDFGVNRRRVERLRAMFYHVRDEKTRAEPDV